MNNKINGISCKVENCKYHDKENACTAEKIHVGNADAMHVSETKCETFECQANGMCE